MEDQIYTGHIGQLFDVKRYVFADGRSKGVEAVEIQNGSGLDAVILVDKCMDIYQLRYKGKNLNFITPAGIVSPYFYNALHDQWIRSWEGGFLTTCGLDNIGTPSEDDGREYGLHGRIHHTPAEDLHVELEQTDENIVFTMEGKIPQAVMFGENLLLKRKISCKYKTDELFIEDTVCNRGYKPQPLMMLYHFNMGYPLLSEKARYVIPSSNVAGRDEYAQKHMGDWQKITPPTEDFQEMCYYHKLRKNADDSYTVGIDNESEQLFLRIQYESDVLDKFVQWKMFGCGEYVSGLEPCTSTINGRADARANGTLKYLQAGQSIVNRFRIAVSDDKNKVIKYGAQ